MRERDSLAEGECVAGVAAAVSVEPVEPPGEDGGASSIVPGGTDDSTGPDI